jgi:hypothetical protein
MKNHLSRSRSAFSIAELFVAMAIAALAMAAVFSSSISLQRCFSAAQGYATAKTDQARLSDFMALDLRRAYSVTPGADSTTIMTLKMPDYYDSDGQPRTPTITKYVAYYGGPNASMTVVYRKIGPSICRQENGGPLKVVATNVSDFQLSVEDLGKIVKTKVTFIPQFRRGGGDESSRAATTHTSTTLLRNIRKDITP